MIRVLLVENNPADAQRALDLLREKEDGQIEVTHVERLSSALHRLGRESFDAILMADLSQHSWVGYAGSHPGRAGPDADRGAR